ncbi:hypothetical protein C8Q76DRAFT_715810 [Earliella scabrosa]|nr:hypothetical protein C8Q76DRAFT_715810 [Earliella scabrosa]
MVGTCRMADGIASTEEMTAEGSAGRLADGTAGTLADGIAGTVEGMLMLGSWDGVLMTGTREDTTPTTLDGAKVTAEKHRGRAATPAQAARTKIARVENLVLIMMMDRPG